LAFGSNLPLVLSLLPVEKYERVFRVTAAVVNGGEDLMGGGIEMKAGDGYRAVARLVEIVGLYYKDIIGRTEV